MLRRHRGLALAAVTAPFLLLTAAPLAMAAPDETALQAMRALGRTQDPTYVLGEVDKPGYCQRHYGIAEAGFDYPSQSFYCRTNERWIKLPLGPACVEQFGERAFAQGGGGGVCLRLGGQDPGENRPNTQSGTVVRIEPGTVDTPFEVGANGQRAPSPPTSYGLDAASKAPASAVAQPGVADAPSGANTLATTGPIGAFNGLPVFVRVLIAGGGAMIVGLWAGGYAIRFMP